MHSNTNSSKRENFLDAMSLFKKPKVEAPFKNLLQFIDLPDDILYKIINYLNVEDKASLSITCHNLRQICLTSYYLVFDYTLRIQNMSTKSRRNFLLCILRFLSNRAKMKINKEIKGFFLHWECADNESYIFDERFMICSCINEVLDSSFNLQHLALNLRWSSESNWPPFKLPINVSLKILHLDLSGEELCLPDVNSDMISLEQLSLECVKIDTEHNLCEWISKSCKRLKRLGLSHLSGVTNIKINSEIITHLSIDNCNCRGGEESDIDELVNVDICAQNLKELYIKWRHNSVDINKSMKLYAPNLKFLYWYSYPLRNCDLGTLNALCKATVSFAYATHLPHNINYVDLCYLIRSVRAAKSISLNSCYLEMLEGNMPMKNLERLRIVTFSLIEHDEILIPAILKFLEKAPNLKTVTTSKYLDLEELSDTKVPELKQSTIQEFKNALLNLLHKLYQ